MRDGCPFRRLGVPRSAARCAFSDRRMGSSCAEEIQDQSDSLCVFTYQCISVVYMSGMERVSDA